MAPAGRAVGEDTLGYAGGRADRLPAGFGPPGLWAPAGHQPFRMVRGRARACPSHLLTRTGTEGRIMDDWWIVAGKASRMRGVEGPPLEQTVREIWRTLDGLNRCVTLVRRASSESERQAYIAAIDRQSARLEARGGVVVDQCRAGLPGG